MLMFDLLDRILAGELRWHELRRVSNWYPVRTPRRMRVLAF